MLGKFSPKGTFDVLSSLSARPRAGRVFPFLAYKRERYRPAECGAAVDEEW